MSKAQNIANLVAKEGTQTNHIALIVAGLTKTQFPTGADLMEQTGAGHAAMRRALRLIRDTDGVPAEVQDKAEQLLLPRDRKTGKPKEDAVPEPRGILHPHVAQGIGNTKGEADPDRAMTAAVRARSSNREGGQSGSKAGQASKAGPKGRAKGSAAPKAKPAPKGGEMTPKQAYLKCAEMIESGRAYPSDDLVARANQYAKRTGKQEFTPQSQMADAVA